MTELIDWDETTPLNPGSPGFSTLAIKVSGTTRRPADRVFAAVEDDPADGLCRVLVAAEIPDVGPEVLSPYSVTIRATREGIHTFALIGASLREEVKVLRGPTE
jgi:hypothetical protein